MVNGICCHRIAVLCQLELLAHHHSYNVSEQCARIMLQNWLFGETSKDVLLAHNSGEEI